MLKNNFLKNIFTLLFAVIVFCQAAIAEESINISQLKETITMLQPNKFAGLRVIEKAWIEYDEDFLVRSRFELRFFGMFDSPKFARRYWRSIPVYDGLKEIKVSEREYSECGVEQSVIRTSGESSVYLVIGTRIGTFSPEMVPRSDPSTLLVKLFKLTVDNKILDMPHIYFSKIREQTVSELVCSPSDIDKILNEIRL
ncbi:MAG: hypothetical protein HQL87_16975 [Magnetococcales bacterium]|nr:hypothetical protein [Magnetococcales bacterium]